MEPSLQKELEGKHNTRAISVERWKWTVLLMLAVVVAQLTFSQVADRPGVKSIFFDSWTSPFLIFPSMAVIAAIFLITSLFAKMGSRVRNIGKFFLGLIALWLIIAISTVHRLP